VHLDAQKPLRTLQKPGQRSPHLAGQLEVEVFVSLINNLPAHVLLVHAVVVLIPLAALMTVLSAVWPTVGRRLGVLTPIVAFVGLVFVPLTTEAGEWLEAHLPASDLIERHTAFGDGVLPWAAGLTVLAVVGWLQRSPWAVGRPGAAVLAATWARIVVPVLAVVVATGSVVLVVQAGDSGAKAAWADQQLTQQPAGRDGDNG